MAQRWPAADLADRAGQVIAHIHLNAQQPVTRKLWNFSSYALQHSVK